MTGTSEPGGVVRTIGFPGRYVQGPGALAGIGRLFADLGYRRPLALADGVVKDKVWPAASAALAEAGIAPALADFPGECTRAVIAALSEAARAEGIDSVVVFGGGKAIDSAKGVARALDLPIVICPTVASSDAPTSRLIVLYDETHRLVGVDFTRRNPDAVVVDTAIIAKAPARLFAAGIGDAMSKRFEARQCRAAGGLNSFGTQALETALLLTETVFDRLCARGPAAYAAVRAGTWSPDVESVVEATVLVSGVGFESGGLSLAHALIRGLTAIPAMAGMLHGELVAFSTLVQLCVEGQDEAACNAVMDLMAAVDLPMTLAALGQSEPLTEAEKALVAEATLATNYSRHMAPPLTAEALIRGIEAADALGRARGLTA
ncbi:glycerol dehydrogenase [Pseudoxanthobacter soli DSM 19599]|uniref:Glycerol dehydrogenase n=1 Tax=Pseudoxanthobacter soli DSM 19599 TaxID=1123029 RepID=A0A1M7ZNS8_9HYPH|nr:glycerol dehydrogenase [Pseudoxanthobacter soli]SHO66521.1 glycerol dehydrogenase [Pseudoxanthobacter soli DSM 19599]